jgi:hypothetical protein
MAGKIIKSRKSMNCCECEGKIKYGENYKKYVEVIGEENCTFNFCLNCVKKHDLCNKGDHDFVEKINTVWESGVPYPEYTDDFVCQNCGVIREK